MTATISLAIVIDDAYIEAEAARRNKPADVILQEFIAGLECDLDDVCRHRRGHGVESVRSRVHQFAQV